MISPKHLQITISWIAEVAESYVDVSQQSTFVTLIQKYLETYINDQEGADRKTYQLYALGCMRAVSCLTNKIPFGSIFQSDLCCDIYTQDQLKEVNQNFLTWLIQKTCTTPSLAPGPKKKILHQNSKSIVFLTEDQIVVKCTSHLSATIEILSQSLLLPRGGPNDNCIVTLLGGHIVGDDTVELFYPYLPFELCPSPSSHSSVVRKMVRDLVRGVQVLHRAGLAHRDLKFQNLRLTKEGRVTIIDLDGAGYGLRFTDIVTTIVTRAPEVLLREIQAENEPYMYDPKPLDLWSLGILALELAQGSSLPVPMEVTASSMLEVLESHLPLMLCSHDVQKTLGPRLFEAVRRCVEYDPRLRPTIEDLQAYCIETREAGPLY
jgi:hypothetical protein